MPLFVVITPNTEISFESEFGGGTVRAAVLAVPSTQPRTSPVRLSTFREMLAPAEISAGALHLGQDRSRVKIPENHHPANILKAR
jgi:hypothetical protein